VFTARYGLYLCVLCGSQNKQRLFPGKARARFSAPVQTGPGAHPASFTMDTGLFPGVKRPGRGVDHPPPSSAEVKEGVELYLYSPSGPSGPVLESSRDLYLSYRNFPELAAKTENGSCATFCHQVSQYRYFLHQSSQLCSHDPMLRLNKCLLLGVLSAVRDFIICSSVVFALIFASNSGKLLRKNRSRDVGYDPETKQRACLFKSPSCARPKKMKKFRLKLKSFLWSLVNVRALYIRNVFLQARWLAVVMTTRFCNV
jgi:hypothetical protein